MVFPSKSRDDDLRYQAPSAIVRTRIPFGTLQVLSLRVRAHDDRFDPWSWPFGHQTLRARRRACVREGRGQRRSRGRVDEGVFGAALVKDVVCLPNDLFRCELDDKEHCTHNRFIHVKEPFRPFRGQKIVNRRRQRPFTSVGKWRRNDIRLAISLDEVTTFWMRCEVERCDQGSVPCRITVHGRGRFEGVK